MTASGTRVCLLLAAGLLSALNTGAAGESRFDGEVKRILAQKSLRGAKVAFQAVDLETGSVGAEREQRTPMVPASNQKIVTGVAALELLGSQYKFETLLAHTGTLENGEIRGDLFFVGRGDPNLSGRFFNDDPMALFNYWAQKLREKGIERITGDLVADDRFFDRQFVHPDWPEGQLNRWYCAPVAALSANDNCVLLAVKPGKAGEPAQAALQPDSGFFSISNSCRTAGSRVIVSVARTPAETGGRPGITVKGTIPARVKEWTIDVAVYDPPLFACSLLSAALRKAGIELKGRTRYVQPDDESKQLQSLVSLRSDMERTLSVMTRNSQNFYAEQLFKTISAAKTGKGSWAESQRILTEWAKANGIGGGEIAISDGSGMSRQNRLTASAIVALLVRAKRAGYGELFQRTLPVAGENGTLEKRLGEAPYKGNVWAKTGYLRGVGALSGYARTRSGKLVAFSILVNDFRGTGEVKAVLDDIVAAIVDFI